MSNRISGSKYEGKYKNNNDECTIMMNGKKEKILQHQLDKGQIQPSGSRQWIVSPPCAGSILGVHDVKHAFLLGVTIKQQKNRINFTRSIILTLTSDTLRRIAASRHLTTLSISAFESRMHPSIWRIYNSCRYTYHTFPKERKYYQNFINSLHNINTSDTKRLLCTEISISISISVIFSKLIRLITLFRRSLPSCGSKFLSE